MKEDTRKENIPKKEVLKKIISILKKIFTFNYYNKLNIQEQYILNIGVKLEKIFEQQNILNIQNLENKLNIQEQQNILNIQNLENKLNIQEQQNIQNIQNLENKLNIQEQQNIQNIQNLENNEVNLENKLNNNIFLSAILKNGFFYIQICTLEYKKQNDFLNNYDFCSSVIINSEQFTLIKILHVNNIDYNMNIELISKLKNLQSLYLYDSYNYSLIVDLEPIQHLMSLNLCSCRFQVNFSHLKNLQSLYIDCNKYSNPEETISYLENLKILTISNFKKYHNIDLSSLQNLQYLTLNNIEFNKEVHNGVESLNLDLSSLQNLKVLNLCYNVLNNGVILDISSLQNLQILNDYFNSGFIQMTGLKLKYYYKDDNLVLDETIINLV
jgi:hypothetical protein